MDEYAARSKLELDRRPLPANFQAKWVPSAKRFVFINHSTRTTTWDDPRPPVAMPLVGSSGHTVFSQLNKDPIKDLKEQFPDASDDVLRQCWQSSGQNKAIVVAQIKSMGYADKLSSSDSFELKGITSSAGAGNDYSTGMYSTSFVSPEAEARRKREEQEAARKRQADAEAKRRADAARAAEEQRKSEARRDAAKKAAAEKLATARVAAANKKAADIKKTADKKAADRKAAEKRAALLSGKAASPPKPKALTAAEKKRIEKRMAQDYKDIEAETINMVLGTFSYDEMRTKMVLDGERVKASSGGGSSAAAAPTSSGASVRQEFVAPPLPTFESSAPEPLPSTSFTAKSASSYLDRKPGYGMPSSADSGDFFASVLGDRKKQSVPWSTKKGSSALYTQTTQKKTTQPATQPTMDPTQMLGANRNMDFKAVGANSALVVGANSDLLRDADRLARGRNPRMANGSAKQLRVGAAARPAGRSTLAVGKSCRVNGSDPDYHVGPDKNRRMPLLAGMSDV